MLGLGSDIAGVTIQSIAPDMQMWGVDSSGAGLETGKVTFKFKNLYFENFEQCYAHMDDNLNPSSICNTIASSLTNVAPGAGGDRIHHGCQAGKTWVRVAALGAKGIDATYSTAAESISIDIDQGISLETSTVMTEGDGYMNQVAGSHINAQFDCAKSFRDGFCTSGVFGEQAKGRHCLPKLIISSH